jgi:hypothetical protein
MENYAIKLDDGDWYVTKTLPNTIVFNVEASL